MSSKVARPANTDELSAASWMQPPRRKVCATNCGNRATAANRPRRPQKSLASLVYFLHPMFRAFFRVRGLWSLLVLTLTVLQPSAPSPAAIAMADPADVLRWDLVGHIADQPIAWLAVPPDGLASGVLFARAVDSSTTFIVDGQTNGQPGAAVTRRSRDGGKTWDRVPEAPGRMILPPGGAPAFSLARDALYRSIDAGQTWNSVAPLQADELLFSPNFKQDGVVFLRGSDHLWRSTDGGLTWTNLDPGAGQSIAAVRLSPAYGSDHTLFVGADSARPSGLGKNPPPTDNADSLGVLVSADGGTSWASVADGLQIDATPYRQIVDIAISPNFSTDQTLYVSGLGPWQPPDRPSSLCSSCMTPRVGMFRSHDAGASWEAVNQLSFQTNIGGGSLSASPGYADDHMVSESLSQRGAAPSQSGCSLAVSADGGDSWHEAKASSNGAGLCGMGIVRAAASTVLLAYQPPYYLSAGPNRNIEHSRDGGASWTMLAPPGDGLVNGLAEDLAQRQTVLSDRVLQATQNGDLWDYGPFPPCAIQPTLGFGQVWTQQPEWQDSAGCPLAQEQPVQINAEHKDLPVQGPTDVYWTPDGSACVQVTHDVQSRVQGSAVNPANCADPPEQQLPGSILRFRNGQYWLYIADAPGHGVVVNSNSAPHPAALELTP